MSIARPPQRDLAIVVFRPERPTHRTPTTTLILIDATRLAASRPNRPLFGDVSITVSDGDRIGVVGINGSGKTTLLDARPGRSIRRRTPTG